MSSDTAKFPKNLIVVASGLVDMVEEIVVCDDLFVFIVIDRASKSNVNLIISDIIFMFLDTFDNTCSMHFAILVGLLEKCSSD